MTVFSIPVHSKTRSISEGRVIFLSDAHYGSFGGVGGYSDVERTAIMIDRLIEEYNTDRSYDAVVFVGDTVSANHDLLLKRAEKGSADFSDEEETAVVRAWKDTYMSRLERENIPCFYVNASHDALYGDNFKNVFGYENNYVLEVGDVAYICVDSYAGPRMETTLETTAMDIPDAFLSDVTAYLSGDTVREAYVVSHYPFPKENMKALCAHEKVRALLAGHSHYNTIDQFLDKPLIQTGHFSRAYTRMVTYGLGFKPFVPLNDSTVEMTLDEDGRERRDHSATGSPWQWRVMESSAAGVESYIVFVSMNYGAFFSDGIDFPAFFQPYTEARPAFLGENAPIDRSYIFFSK